MKKKEEEGGRRRKKTERVKELLKPIGCCGEDIWMLDGAARLPLNCDELDSIVFRGPGQRRDSCAVPACTPSNGDERTEVQ